MRPVLVVEHQATCPPARVGEWLVEAGLALDVRRPWAGDPPPTDLAEHAALVVLGGEMSANDDDTVAWLGPVKALIRTAADGQVPVLGICLGHQLAAVALGGTVERSPHERLVGVLPLTSTGADDAVLAPESEPMPEVAVFWNSDLVTRLPDGAVVLARSARGEVQAARFAQTVWGVQCHPEADESIARQWAKSEADELRDLGIDVEERLAEITRRQDQLDACWRPVVRRWAERVTSRLTPNG